ncbi:hypothetical protein [Nocardia sp. NPDC003979]
MRGIRQGVRSPADAHIDVAAETKTRFHYRNPLVEPPDRDRQVGQRRCALRFPDFRMKQQLLDRLHGVAAVAEQPDAQA